MSLVYGGALLVSIFCLGLLDHRFRLFLFADVRRAVAVLVLGVAFFLAVDVVAIGQGIFVKGQGPWMSGVVLAPHLPVEELGFLVLLCYSAMLAYTGAVRVLARRAEA